LSLKPTNLIVSGGGSNSELFMNIFANVYGLPASRNIVNGAAGLGAAICAALATKVYPDYITAIENMVKTRDSFKPNPDSVALYKKMNEEVYRHITKYTDEILKKSFPIFG